MADDLDVLKGKIEKHSESLNMFKWVIGIQVTIVIGFLFAAIPWANNIQANLAVLASNVQKIDTAPPVWLIERLSKVEEKVEKLTTINYGSSK